MSPGDVTDVRPAGSSDSDLTATMDVLALGKVALDVQNATDDAPENPDAEGAAETAEEDASDAVSRTSTEMYQMEPFETLKTRLLGTLHELLNISADVPLDVLHCKGGTYNRVVKITVGGDAPQKLVMRLPRFPDAGIQRSVADLRYLEKHTNVPVPTVVKYCATEPCLDGFVGDWSSNRHIFEDGRFTLMTQIPGETLETALPAMSLEQKKDIARQVAQVLAEIHSVTVPNTYGRVYVEADSPEVYSYEGAPDLLPVVKLSPTADAPSVQEYLMQYFDAYQRVTTEREYFRIYKYAQRLLEGIPCIGAQITAEAQRPTFAHTDFAPRNVMVEYDTTRSAASKDVKTCRLTGVLDWDEPEVLPAAAAYAYPSWLWGYEHFRDGSPGCRELDADPDGPVHGADNAQIKAIFDEAILQRIPDYLDIIREGRRLALKQLFEMARSALCSGDEKKLFEKFDEAVTRLARAKPPAGSGRSSRCDQTVAERGFDDHANNAALNMQSCMPGYPESEWLSRQ